MFISSHISLVLFSPDSAEADFGCGGKLNDDLVATVVLVIFVPKIIKIG